MKKKSSPLSFLGFGKSKDSEAALSKAVFDSLAKFDKLDSEAQKREIVGVIERVAPLGDGDDKAYLVAAIADSFQHASEALAKKEEVGKILDGLYAKCREADELASKAVVDAILGKEPTADEKAAKEKADKEKADKEKADKEKAEREEAGKKGAGGAPQDSAKLVEDTIAKALAGVAETVSASVKNELPSLVEKTVREALGIQDAGGRTADSRTDDDFEDKLDPSFLLEGVFGNS